jgi:hypothetical protein
MEKVRYFRTERFSAAVRTPDGSIFAFNPTRPVRGDSWVKAPMSDVMCTGVELSLEEFNEMFPNAPPIPSISGDA